MTIAAALVVFAFLAGSIPNGYLIARAHGVDIRKQGSGNIGATNVWRTLGRGPGLLCFFLDFLKGLVPSVLAGLFINGQITSPLAGALSETQRSVLWLGVAIAAVFGHMFTPWLGFKGGKGIACGFGAMLGIYPIFTLAAIVAIIVWAIAVKLTKMVGISSVIAAIALTLVVVGAYFAPPSAVETLSHIPLFRKATGFEAAFTGALCVLIIYKHRGNIARTFAGTERKIGQKAMSGPPKV
jgi:glycerol-3-phosphate acyltransferase PlsY